MKQHTKAIYYGLGTIFATALVALPLITHFMNQKVIVSISATGYNESLISDTSQDYSIQYLKAQNDVDFKIVEVNPNPDIEFFIDTSD